MPRPGLGNAGVVCVQALIIATLETCCREVELTAAFVGTNDSRHYGVLRFCYANERLMQILGSGIAFIVERTFTFFVGVPPNHIRAPGSTRSAANQVQPAFLINVAYQGVLERPPLRISYR